MRLLLITRYFPPLDSIASARLYCWAKYLSEMGHQITVLTTCKEGQVLQALNYDLSAFDVIEVSYFDPITFFGTSKKKVYQTNFSKRGKIKQWLYRFYRERLNERIPGRTDPWILPAIKELKRLKGQKVAFDAIVSSYAPPASHLIALKAKKLFECPWVADFRDLWVDSHFSKGIWPFRSIERMLEKKVCCKADLVTTVSEGFKDVLVKKYPGIPVKVIRNGFDREQYEGIPNDYFSQEEKRFRMVFTGSLLSRRYNMRPLMQAIRHLLDTGKWTSTTFQLLFYGHSVDNLLDLIKEYRLEGIVEHRGAVSLKEAYAAQKSADAFLLIERQDPEYDGILNAKIYEYLYVGAPVLGLGITSKLESGKMLEETGSGVACGEDIEKIQSTLVKMVNGEYRGKQKREQIEAFSRKAQAHTLAELLDSLKAAC